MNRPCPEFEPLLVDRAAGVLEPAADVRLDRHLEGCAACRAEADAVALALSLAALPPPSAAERARVAAGAPGALRRDVAVRRKQRFAGLMALAAAAAFAVAVPGYLLSRSSHTVNHAGAVATSEHAPAGAGWEAPDPDELWAAAGAADPEGGDEPAEVLFAELQEVNLDPD